MRFEETSVIITGGSKGIGFSIAKVFARATNRPLVLIARNTVELEEAKQACIEEGATAVDILKLDLTDAEQVSQVSFDAYNPGILVNNAGSFLFKPLEETSFQEFRKQFQINVFGAFTLTRRILPILKDQERGLIVNICSEASLKGFGNSGAYAASKHAMLGYTRSLRKELYNSKIAVTAVNLGSTYSTSWYDSDVKEERLIDPEDVGKLIVSFSELSSRSVAEEIILKPQRGQV